MSIARTVLLNTCSTATRSNTLVRNLKFVIMGAIHGANFSQKSKNSKLQNIKGWIDPYKSIQSHKIENIKFFCSTLALIAIQPTASGLQTGEHIRANRRVTFF